MRCAYCGKPGLRRWKGYCCKAHRKLHKNPPPKMVPCRGCGSPQRRTRSTIKPSGMVYCTRCKRSRGEDHYKWQEGSYVDRAGYRMVLINGNYQKEHRLEWQLANKACLLTKGSIHHIRFDLPHNKVYNDPDNLVLVSDKEHGSFHRLYEARRFNDAFRILKAAGERQLYYAREIDNFIRLFASNQDSSCNG